MHSYGVTLAHSAKGSEWKDHKYIRKKNGTYYYLDENGNETTTTHKEGSDSKSESSDKKDDKSSSEKKEDNKNVSAEAKKIIDSNIKAEDLTAENVEKLAKEVIRGGFGNGQERKDLLGEHYAVIQKRVNELMKDYTSKSSDKKDDKKSASKKTTEDNKKKKSSDTVKHEAESSKTYIGITESYSYIAHVGNENSGRYRRGTGDRPYQHEKRAAFFEKAFTRNVKAGKDKPNISLAEKAAKDTGNAIDSSKNAVKTYDRVVHRKDREEAYKKAYENVKKMSDQEIRDIVNRKNLEKQYVDSLDINKLTKGEQRITDILDVAGDVVGVVGGTLAIGATIYGLKHK